MILLYNRGVKTDEKMCSCIRFSANEHLQKAHIIVNSENEPVRFVARFLLNLNLHKIRATHCMSRNVI